MIRYTFADAVNIQHHIRIAAQAGQLNLSQSFEIAAEVFDRPKSTGGCGYFTNSRNERQPIPGAAIDGKILVPLRDKSEPIRRKIRPVDIDSLIEVGGRVDLAAAHDEPEPEIEVAELLPQNTTPEPIAGDETEVESDLDAETLRVEQAADEALLDPEQWDEEADAAEVVV